MAHTFDELVEKQQVADETHASVQELRDKFGAPTQEGGWTAQESEMYETAWRAWRDLSRDVQAAVAEYAKAEGKDRAEVEAAVQERAGTPPTTDE